MAVVRAFDRLIMRAPESVPPRLGLRLDQHLSHRDQPALELGLVHLLQALDHDCPTLVALGDDQAADRLQGGPGQRVLGDELIEDFNCDVEFANRPKRASQTLDFAECLPLLGAFDPRCENRNRLAQPPRRHPGLMNTVRVATNGVWNVPFESRGPAREQPARDRGLSPVHGRMSARVGKKRPIKR